MSAVVDGLRYRALDRRGLEQILTATEWMAATPTGARELADLRRADPILAVLPDDAYRLGEVQVGHVAGSTGAVAQALEGRGWIVVNEASLMDHDRGAGVLMHEARHITNGRVRGIARGYRDEALAFHGQLEVRSELGLRSSHPQIAPDGATVRDILERLHAEPLYQHTYGAPAR